MTSRSHKGPGWPYMSERNKFETYRRRHNFVGQKCAFPSSLIWFPYFILFLFFSLSFSSEAWSMAGNPSLFRVQTWHENCTQKPATKNKTHHAVFTQTGSTTTYITWSATPPISCRHASGKKENHLRKERKKERTGKKERERRRKRRLSGKTSNWGEASFKMRESDAAFKSLIIGAESGRGTGESNCATGADSSCWRKT